MSGDVLSAGESGCPDRRTHHRRIAHANATGRTRRVSQNSRRVSAGRGGQYPAGDVAATRDVAVTASGFRYLIQAERFDVFIRRSIFFNVFMENQTFSEAEHFV